MGGFSIGIGALVAIGLAASSMAQEPTPLDEAVAAGSADPALRNDFYRLFLETTVFAIVARETDGSRESIGEPGFADDGEISVAFIASEWNGLPLINLFDTTERMHAFAASRSVFDYDVARLTGREATELMPGDYWLLLNPETDSQLFFDPDTVRWLRAGMRDTELFDQYLPDIELELPSREALLAMTDILARVMEGRTAVRSAWLMQRAAGDPNGASGLLFLEFEPEVPQSYLNDVAPAIAREIGEQQFGSIGYFDMTTITPIQKEELALPLEAQVFVRP